MNTTRLVIQTLALATLPAADEALTSDEWEMLGWHLLKLADAARTRLGILSASDEATLFTEAFMARMNAGDDPTAADLARIEELSARTKLIDAHKPRDRVDQLLEQLRGRLADGTFNEGDFEFSISLGQRLKAIQVEIEAEKIVARAGAAS